MRARRPRRGHGTPSRLRCPHPRSSAPLLLPGTCVRRPRLERLLDDLTKLPVTLCRSRRGGQVHPGRRVEPAHHRRDRLGHPGGSDAHPVALWSLLVASLDRVRPGWWAEMEPLLRDSDVDAVVARLGTLGADGDPVLLVVDNLHHLETDPESDPHVRAAGRAPARDAAPPPGHATPPGHPRGPDARRGRLAEIGFAETAVLGRRVHGGPREPRAAPCPRRSPGSPVEPTAGPWPLQLMALASRTARAMPMSEDRESTADQLLERYLRREVLAGEPAEPVVAPGRHERGRPGERRPGRGRDRQARRGGPPGQRRSVARSW